MKIAFVITGTTRENTYIVSDEKTNECLVIDPGDNTEKIEKLLITNDLNPIAVLLTHCHFDHIISVNALRDKYGASVYAGINEKELALNPELNKSTEFLGYSISLTVDTFLKEEKINIGAFFFDVITTPGHTRGCVCYHFYDDKIIFTGDTLFRASVGRTDLPCAEPLKLIPSIKEKLLCLDGDTVVYPGHGMKTTIEHERTNNPYVR